MSPRPCSFTIGTPVKDEAPRRPSKEVFDASAMSALTLESPYAAAAAVTAAMSVERCMKSAHVGEEVVKQR